MEVVYFETPHREVQLALLYDAWGCCTLRSAGLESFDKAEDQFLDLPIIVIKHENPYSTQKKKKT